MHLTYYKYYRIFSIFFLILFVSGCIIVKKETKEETPQQVTLSPKPEIEMSDELVRSKKGDMIALLPADWFFVDLEEDVSAETFAVAVNPDYTLSAVFTNFRSNATIDTIVAHEALNGLARIAFERHQKKTAGAVKQINNFDNVMMGNLNFVKYEFSSTGGAIVAQAAVFVSSLNQYYEFAIVPLDFRGKPIPTKEEIDKIFKSILATIQY